MIPTTNAGRVETTEQAMVTPRSNQLPRLTAATVPAVPPISTARTTASERDRQVDRQPLAD